MSLFSPLLVIGLDQGNIAATRKLVSDCGFADAHVVEDGFANAIRALALRSSSPDYILVDVGGASHDVLPALDNFATYCDAHVRVVVVGQTNDIHFYRELKQRGVIEYFAYPVSPQDILAVLVSKQTAQPIAEPSGKQGVVISCMSAASGDGGSTLAMNLAYALASRYNQPTVLVDLDYQFGLVAKNLDLNAPFGMREVLEHPERGLDELLVSKMLVSYKDRLSIIAAPSELRILPAIRSEIIRTLISILRRKFKFIVIDLPHLWTDWTGATISYSDHTVLTAQLWLRSLTHATRLAGAWQAAGVNLDHTSLVINRSGAKYKEAVSSSDFERIYRRPIAAVLHNDVKAISQAENNAQTLFEIEQSTLLKQQIMEFAESLTLRYAAELANQLPATEKKSLFPFAKIRKGS
ncbi:MAG: AAA family ATPase [Rickettsiales bacterium]|jgi:pilus assembly protein CpaE|nr:AAA family ATPase [Rickettsiales bacterium]